MSTLYLIPITIEDDAIEFVPPIVVDTLNRLDCFMVERTRTARRFIKKMIPDYDIDGSDFYEMDKREASNNIAIINRVIETNRTFGIMSESGTPCVADPGYRIVDYARDKGYTIVPLSGPSSIIMALMASGFNGQEFVFHGYLPIKDNGLKSALKKVEDHVRREKYTQIFIETPYRNNSMLSKICEVLHPTLRLCVAANLTGPSEKIITMSIAEWKKSKASLDKVPAIFLIGI